MIEYQPYPKMVYHPETKIGTIVKDKEDHEALLASWAAVEPEKPRRGRPPKS